MASPSAGISLAYYLFLLLVLRSAEGQIDFKEPLYMKFVNKETHTNVSRWTECTADNKTCLLFLFLTPYQQGFHAPGKQTLLNMSGGYSIQYVYRGSGTVWVMNLNPLGTVLAKQTGLKLKWIVWWLEYVYRSSGTVWVMNLNPLGTVLFKQTGLKLKVVMAQAVFRNGASTVGFTYPTDRYKNKRKYWSEGYAQLTNHGKRQNFLLGRALRQRYGRFMSDEYVPNEVYVLSSDADRAIMGSQLTLAGIYTPVPTDQKWHSEIDWQPIPVHTLPAYMDLIFRNRQGRGCTLSSTSSEDECFGLSHTEAFGFEI
uniref:acid phosphatase n=1 Tax=Timema poppense TaxID=170557 RepID=A0A7R9DAE9_TIMPO|nr:unnamed protein product [Timema poppensis]